MNVLPITEQPNPRSKDIDVQDPLMILKTLAVCEGEIFGGFHGSRGVLDEEIIGRCLSIAQRLHEAIRCHEHTHVVFIGAGTSGRLCRLLARVMAPLCGSKLRIIPIIAGGIKALVRAEPNTEDRFEAGVNDFLEHTKDIDRSNCLTIGVSCGLSANYVKGALAASVKHRGYGSAVIGFNPEEQSTVDIREGNDAITLVNPIVGPEAIVGSVRMKGGTATMLLLSAIVTCALADTPDREQIDHVISAAQTALGRLGDAAGEVAELVTKGGRTLRQGGRIHLLGTSPFGALCIYDAAECPPTFGAKPEQVNGYTERGIEDLVCYVGERATHLTKDVSLAAFVTNILPEASPNDLIVALMTSNGQPGPMLQAVLGAEQDLACVVVGNSLSLFQQIIFVRSLLIQLSTGSFTLSGKIFENKMVDLRITNKKLYHRALRIVAQITQRSEGEVREQLLNVIYGGSQFQGTTLEEHIRLASSIESVVPRTILSLLYPLKDLAEIQAMLTREPVVRKLIMRELQNASSGDVLAYNTNSA